MWHSLTPKMIHVNQRWMVITDDKKVGKKRLQIPYFYAPTFFLLTRLATSSIALSFLCFSYYYIPLFHLFFSYTLPQVMYAEVLVASVGSLAYAEDDGRHILGVKVARSPASLRGGMGEGDGIECHVLECESEVS